MENLQHKALVIGATGLVGKALVKQLQAAPEFDAVTVIVRHQVDEFDQFSKVNQFVLDDFLLLNDQDVNGYSHAFSCLGSTIKKAGSKQNFYAIDYEINAHFADLLQDKGAHLLLVSALGANSSSIVFYNRVKGQLEDYLKTLTLSKLSIFHPSLLIGEREEQRTLEAAAQKIFLLLKDTIKKPFLYKPVTAEQVAHSMIVAANTQMENFKVYDNLEIQTTP
ncbi:nucleoside-diphosphate sugar epimerase [Acinetobacter ihumii]|uniref:nucleoside-diphosphate sugar epimerase n=1 Tax=Acinetobacter ihumii TaxID=2483802 RepID=UPI001030666D|nr:nucleoside-diphosphate sugar epimerase [Acinetobacter ihumii]